MPGKKQRGRRYSPSKTRIRRTGAHRNKARGDRYRYRVGPPVFEDDQDIDQITERDDEEDHCE
jgi:hypothetical protein